MKRVLVKDLKEGYVFSAPVFIEGKNLFVPAGIPVRKKDIARLNFLAIESVQTEGELIDNLLEDGTAESIESINSKITVESEPTKDETPVPEKGKPSIVSLSEVHENKGAYRLYMDFVERLDAVCQNIAIGTLVEARTIDGITGSLLQAVRDQRQSYIEFILGGEIENYEMAKSLVNTSILSALMAMELKLPGQKVSSTVTGALLHDVGMLRMPNEIVQKKGGLSPEELKRIQSHPVHTYNIVTKEIALPESVGVIVLQHHERWDGEGYPKRIAGQGIDIGARIVSVADAFEAMVSKKPYRKSMLGYQAMKNLLSDNMRRFDPYVIKAFTQTMGIYPIGSIVLLNNGAIARVVKVMPVAALRPRIKLLVDESGKVFKQDEGAEIDLLAEKSLFISKAMDPTEVSAKYAQ
jgi:HD-GYP domain-containing protein (c-di-GMP phosphodiesterase class II)